MNWIHVKTDDNYEVPLLWFPAKDTAAPKLLFLPALGVKAGFYSLFAEALSQRGISIALLEQRGHGKSSLRPSRQNDWGFKTFIEKDIQATLGWLNKEAPDGKTILGGHSLGGQLAIASSGLIPERFDALLAVACASPYYGNYRGSIRQQLYWSNKLAPLLFLLFGYFPGKKLGLGDNARTLMRDWMQLARYNRFSIAGIGRELEAEIKNGKKALLSLSFARDHMANRASIDSMNRKLAQENLQHIEIDDAAQGARADHFSWAKHPRAVVDYICAWALS